jgi:hypothetical protein
MFSQRDAKAYGAEQNNMWTLNVIEQQVAPVSKVGLKLPKPPRTKLISTSFSFSKNKTFS